MTPLSVIIFFLFAVVWPHASSLQQSARNRRAFIGSAAALIGGTNFVTFESADALISSKYCASGVGDGCDDLSEGNELIKSLQEKSAAKRDQYAQASRRIPP
ncbi:predicted protein [Phaeodactylum tricornutum CCAP 1055/1]|uniref:Uncharacterized protein n=2 Tax=Phaeodactylum tricornutum TaxID=2850 RepID=B7G784_PHATC|nr:predicted protein [Phaeodactylum tricornutum CCAP 1055/1]EEC45598.1 predicted protein [Phaeodactylum tricornutum CCAP 1055/1]|eukprot:XP_002182862.1 predicted protein [Phaeodactylum tricornutum CCAP 1055/1]